MRNPDFDLLVWDFDGVLNANIVDGRFVWADRLHMDLGIDPQAFSDFIFRSGRMREVVSGRMDLLDVVGPWLADQGHSIAAPEFLRYWWQRDARPDGEVMGWARAVPVRQVIGTNNEGHRARYIEEEMDVAHLVEQIFASGRMGVAKPDPGFFQHIQDWAGVPPDRILLVDDNAPNIAAAQDLGWHGFHFTPESRALLPGRLGL
ncbi:MAG: HAD-IA family hydrolase [Pseudomonadota bacterium]